MARKKNEFKLGQIFDPSFEKLSPNEKLQNIDAVACKVIEGSYTKVLTQDELGIAKSDLADVSIKIAHLMEQKKAKMAEYTELLNKPKTESAELIEMIKHKSVRMDGLIYLVDDQESGTMNIFDKNAICVDSRPLSPTERQTTMKAIRKVN